MYIVGRGEGREGFFLSEWGRFEVTETEEVKDTRSHTFPSSPYPNSNLLVFEDPDRRQNGTPSCRRIPEEGVNTIRPF